MSVSIHDDDPRARILQAIQLVAGPALEAGGICELRVPNSFHDGKVVGYFDASGLDAMAEAAHELSGNAEAVYISLNPIRPVLLARAKNRPLRWAKAMAADTDVIRRVWLLIDVDAAKPDSHISASESEYAAAVEKTARIREWLIARGWPANAIVFAKSGNGGHLLVRIDLPADDGGLIQRVLRAIQAAFPDAIVDQTVFNAARVSKLYGTMACKGDEIDDRRHRLAKLIEVPATLEIVTREQLETLAGGSAPRMPAASDAAIEAHATAIDQPRQVAVITGQRAPDKPGFDVASWLVKHGLRAADGKTKPLRDDARGVDGTLYELSHCVHRPDESDGGPYVIRWADGRITAGCKHNKCRGKGWAELRDVVEPGWGAKARAKSAILTLENACEQAGGSPATNGDWNFDGEATEALKLLAIEYNTPPQLANRPQKLRQKNGRLYVLVRGNASEKSWNMPGWSYESPFWEFYVKGWQEPEPAEEADKPRKIDLHSFAFAGDELFHSPEKEAFASAGGKTWPVKSETYKLLLRDRMYSQRGMTIADSLLKEIIDTLTAKAIFGGPERQVHLRTAEHEGRYYIDLANERWEAVEISADGWRIVNNPPVRFVRKDGMLPLPTPTHNGKISQLREFLNVDAQSWPLVVMWLMAAMRPGGPYPMLMISGEHGSAKSSFARLLRSLIDPSSVPHCKLPDSGRDLMITAKNSYVLSFDNLSHVPTSMSDLLCSLATRGGYRTRKGYTDDSEMLFSYARPQMLNGISEFATRSDLLSRAFSITLPVVTARKKEAEINAAFEAAKPAILGALLTAAAYGLSRLEAVKAKRLELPRMADAIEWCIATEGGLGFADGEFARAVWANESNATDAALASSPVAGAVLKLMANRAEWHGTASELLAELNRVAGEPIKGAEGKPLLAHKLSKAMSEAAPDLRRRGVEVEIRTKTPKGVTLTTLAEPTAAKPISGGRLYDMVQAMKDQLVAAGCDPEQALEVAIAATSGAYPHRTVIDGMVFRSVEPLTAEDKAKLREHVPGWLAELRACARDVVTAAMAYLQD